MELIKHSVCAINMRLNKNRVCNRIFIVLLSILLIVGVLLILTILLSFLPKGIINQNVIEVFKLFQAINGLILVALITLIAREQEGIVSHVQNLHIILKVFQILNSGIKIGYFILAKWEYLQLSKLIESLNLLNTIIIQRQICKFDQSVQVFDFVDLIEAQIEPS